MSLNDADDPEVLPLSPAEPSPLSGLAALLLALADKRQEREQPDPEHDNPPAA